MLSRTCDSEGVLARPATGAGPLHHARDRSALADSQPDQQPVRTRLTGCRHNSRNQLVHTTQQLPLHHACWVHRNLRGTRSPRCRATAESTRMTSGSRRSPHPHPLRHPLASCPSFSAPFHRNQGKRHHRRNRSTCSRPGRQPEASWGTSRGCQAFLSHNVTHCHTLPHVVTHCHTEPHVSHNIGYDFTEAYVAQVALLPDLGPRAREGGGRGELCLP